MPVVESIEVVVGLQDDFMARHRKARKRATEVWTSLVQLAPVLRQDPFHGDQVSKKRFPRRFKGFDNLWRIALPHGFRALYTVLGQTTGRVKVRVEWLGDHKE
jgi:hypothetical protein